MLDEAGCSPGCGACDGAGRLALARREAVYVYTPDGRGPCFAMEGRCFESGYIHFRHPRRGCPLVHAPPLSLPAGQSTCSSAHHALAKGTCAFIPVVDAKTPVLYRVNKCEGAFCKGKGGGAAGRPARRHNASRAGGSPPAVPTTKPCRQALCIYSRGQRKKNALLYCEHYCDGSV